MDRGALLLYLRNVRDLEVARYRIIVQYNREMRSVEKKKRELEKTNYLEEPKAEDFDDWFGLIFFLIGLGLIGVILWCVFTNYFVKNPKELPYAVIVGIFGVICFVCPFSKWINKAKSAKNLYATTKAHNKAENERQLNNKPVIAKLTTDWKNKEKWYNGEYSKVQQLLADFYGMNILPSQYRNLAAACYIYDYMSTSQASLEDTLIHEHMENGIQRLEAKLDSIIVRLEDIVYETRCLRQNSERTIEQNNNMLSSLRQTEQNTLEAAQYAQLSANYSRANAYFSLATYLKG